MNFNKEISEENLTIQVDGRLDSKTAPELENNVLNDISNCSNIIYDFSDLDYISSAGLRLILKTLKISKKNSGTLVVKNSNELVMDVFKAAGFTKIINFENE